MAISLRPEPEARRPVDSGAGPSHRDCPANVGFRYAADPNGWAFCADTGEFLPVLRELRLDPGVNGVDRSQSEKPLISSVTERRWGWISPDDRRLGEFSGYCVSIRNDKGGRHHFSIFQAPRMVGKRLHWIDGLDESGAARARAAGEAIGPQVGRYRDFLRHLVSSGIVAPMDRAVRDAVIRRQEELLLARTDRLGSDPQNQALAESIAAIRLVLDAMRRGVPVAQILAERGAPPSEPAAAAPSPIPPRSRPRSRPRKTQPDDTAGPEVA